MKKEIKLKQDKKDLLKEAERALILSRAESAIDNDQYEKAAKLYKKAAKMSKMLDEEDKSKIFTKRAKEILIIHKHLRKAEEKRKKQKVNHPLLEDTEDFKLKTPWDNPKPSTPKRILKDD